MSTQHAAGQSVWIDSVVIPDRPALDSNVTTDVCIVGAGIAGLTTAYELTLSGKRVVVLDGGTICSGQTQVTTAHLASVLDDRYFELERIHGEAAARLAAASHGAAIDRIDEIVHEEQIDCDFARVDGYLFGPAPGQHQQLDREFEAARRTGVLDVARVDRAPWPGFDTGPALRFGRQGQFHPLKYLVQLARAIENRGGKIYCQTRAKKMTGGKLAHVETADGPIVTAAHLVVSTNTPVNDLLTIHTKQAPYISYVIGAAIPRGSLPQALYWDMLDPYHYVRVQPGAANAGGDLLIVGGEDHKTGQAHHTLERHERLIRWSRERFSMLGDIEFRWAGQVMETLDGLAYIGRNPLDAPNVYIATGDSGMGMTHGTIAGMLLRDLILGKENPWEQLYDPTRKPVNALARFAKENLNVAAQYTALLTGGDVQSLAEILPGQGAILRQGMTKIAAHRDADGTLHKCSAICPHLGCVVQWNDAEQSWDCPCHGSRFRADGTVTNGPANRNLEPADE